MGLASLIESVLILCWRLTYARRCRVSHSISRAIPIARTLVASDCARTGPPVGACAGAHAEDGARYDSTPWEHGVARSGLGSAAGGYATGFLRGLPRRRTSGAQK